MSVTEAPPEMEVEVQSCLVGCRWPCVFFFWGGEDEDEVFYVDKNQIKQSCGGPVVQFFFEVFRCIVLLL